MFLIYWLISEKLRIWVTLKYFSALHCWVSQVDAEDIWSIGLTTVMMQVLYQSRSSKITILQKLSSTQIELFGTTVLVTTYARVKRIKQIPNFNTGENQYNWYNSVRDKSTTRMRVVVHK